MSGSGLKNLDYELAKELLDFLQEAYPARLHRTYVLNAPLLFRAAVRFFAPFLKAKVSYLTWVVYLVCLLPYDIFDIIC